MLLAKSVTSPFENFLCYTKRLFFQHVQTIHFKNPNDEVEIKHSSGHRLNSESYLCHSNKGFECLSYYENFALDGNKTKRYRKGGQGAIYECLQSRPRSIDIGARFNLSQAWDRAVPIIPRVFSRDLVRLPSTNTVCPEEASVV
jgi:hypothetical protein